MSADIRISLPGDDPLVVKARQGAHTAQAAHEVAQAAVTTAKAALSEAEARLAKSSDSDIGAQLAPLLAAIPAAEAVVRVTARRLEAADAVYQEALDAAAARISAAACAALMTAGRSFTAAAQKTVEARNRYLEIRHAAVTALPADQKLNAAPGLFDSISGAAETMPGDFENWHSPRAPRGMPEGHVRVRFLQQPREGTPGAAGPVFGHMYGAGEIAALPTEETARDPHTGKNIQVPGRVLRWLAAGICQRVEE